MLFKVRVVRRAGLFSFLCMFGFQRVPGCRRHKFFKHALWAYGSGKRKVPGPEMLTIFPVCTALLQRSLRVVENLLEFKVLGVSLVGASFSALAHGPTVDLSFPLILHPFICWCPMGGGGGGCFSPK